MKWQSALCVFALLASSAMAQEASQGTKGAALPALFAGEGPAVTFDQPAPDWFSAPGPDRAAGVFLTGNNNFPGFIGYISNPLYAIDPRAQTEFYPIFASVWFNSFPALPDG